MRHKFILSEAGKIMPANELSKYYYPDLSIYDLYHAGDDIEVKDHNGVDITTNYVSGPRLHAPEMVKRRKCRSCSKHTHYNSYFYCKVHSQKVQTKAEQLSDLADSSYLTVSSGAAKKGGGGVSHSKPGWSY